MKLFSEKFSVQTLLWVDASAALVAIMVLRFGDGWLSSVLELPQSVLNMLAHIALAYSCYSFFLAVRRIRSRFLLYALVVANYLYALFCLALAVFHYFSIVDPLKGVGQGSSLGIAYLFADACIVASLATWERVVFARFFAANED